MGLKIKNSLFLFFQVFRKVLSELMELLEIHLEIT